MVITQTLRSQLIRLLKLHIPLSELVGFEAICHEAVEQHPILSYAMVIDVDGKIVFHNDSDFHDRSITEEPLLSILKTRDSVVTSSQVDGEHYYDFFVPVFDEGEDVIAFVRTGFLKSEVVSKTKTLVGYSIVIGILSFCAACLFLITMLYKWVISPVAQFIGAIETIRTEWPHSAGKLVEVGADDEIGKLATAFNQLTDELHTTTVSKEYLDHILEYQYNSLIITDNNQIIRSVNRETVNLTGYERFELIGQPIKKIFKNPSSTIAKSGSSSSDHVSSGEGFYRTKEGTSKPILFSFGKLLGKDGNLEGYLTVALDITERKKAEAQLLKAQRQAERANESKSRLLASVSHDLRTPVNGVMGMLQLLQTEHSEAKQQEYVDFGIDSCKRLTTQLSDLLDLSKIEAGMLSIDCKPFSLSNAIGNLATMFEFAAEGNRQKVIFNCAQDVPDILLGDEQRLSQIIMNLAGNALKFSTEDVVVDVIVTQKQDDKVTLLVTVIDNGTGIADEDIATLFNMYTQVDSASNRTGAGLGLSIAKSLANLMNGGLCVESEKGKGTCFYLHLPLQITQEEIPPDYSLSAELVASRPFSALVVEDDVLSNHFMSAILKKIGGTVNAVDSAEKGLDALEYNHYDIVFMDVNLPGINGLQATRLIRSDARFAAKADQPVIGLTASTMTGDFEESLEAGMNDYVVKPIEKQTLIEILAKYL